MENKEKVILHGSFDKSTMQKAVKIAEKRISKDFGIKLVDVVRDALDFYVKNAGK